MVWPKWIYSFGCLAIFLLVAARAEVLEIGGVAVCDDFVDVVDL